MILNLTWQYSQLSHGHLIAIIASRNFEYRPTLYSTTVLYDTCFWLCVHWLTGPYGVLFSIIFKSVIFVDVPLRYRVLWKRNYWVPCPTTIFTWLNATAFITLLPKIDAATIQIWPLLVAHKWCLHPYFYNRLWVYTHMQHLFKVWCLRWCWMIKCNHTK